MAPRFSARRHPAPHRWPEGGYFYPPTILQGAGNDPFIMHNEVFGPVLASRRSNDEDVLELANDTEFGLAAGVWTRDIRRGHMMARALQAGTVWINTYRALTFNSPFGGYKASGIGRKNGIELIQYSCRPRASGAS